MIDGQLFLVVRPPSCVREGLMMVSWDKMDVAMLCAETFEGRKPDEIHHMLRTYGEVSAGWYTDGATSVAVYHARFSTIMGLMVAALV